MSRNRPGTIRASECLGRISGREAVSDMLTIVGTLSALGFVKLEQPRYHLDHGLRDRVRQTSGEANHGAARPFITDRCPALRRYTSARRYPTSIKQLSQS